MSAAPATEDFVRLVRDEFDRPAATAGSRVADDLGFDSLMMLELLVVLEIHLGVVLDAGRWDLGSMTLGEVFALGVEAIGGPDT